LRSKKDTQAAVPPRTPGTIWLTDRDVIATRRSHMLARPTERRVLVGKPGERYLLHVWEDGLEQDISAQVPPKWRMRFWVRGNARAVTAPVAWHQIGGAVTVTVVLAATDGTVIERATTRNAEDHDGATLVISPVRPRGQGWSLFDHSHDKRTVWQRLRTWEVVS
jgi:hypothetical protein